MSLKDIQKLYPAHLSRFNFINLINIEIKFERYRMFTESIQNKVDQALPESEQLNQIGFLDRFLLYLIDKMVHGNIASNQILTR